MFQGEVIQNLFPKHNGNNLKINNRKRFGEFANVWELKDTFLHKWVAHWAKQKFQRALGNRARKMRVCCTKVCMFRQ